MSDASQVGAKTYINARGERVPLPFQGGMVSMVPIIKWHDVERTLDPLFAELLEALLKCPPYHAGDPSPIADEKGVYLFTDAGVHLYVGRARKFRGRWNGHTRASSSSASASFAFNIAKREFASVIAGMTIAPQRRGLSENPEFRPLFTAAKARVRAMEFRRVPILDDNVEAIFEVYAALKLQTPFNDFQTH
jgi:hypothetical protein